MDLNAIQGITNLDDVLLHLPKARADFTLVEKPDQISEKIRELKFKLMAFSTLDRKIGYLINYIQNELAPEERCTFLQLFRQSMIRDMILSGLGVFLGIILTKEGAKVETNSRLFRIAVITSGIASIAFSGKTLSDILTFWQIIDDLQTKYCTSHKG